MWLLNGRRKEGEVKKVIVPLVYDSCGLCAAAWSFVVVGLQDDDDDFVV